MTQELLGRHAGEGAKRAALLLPLAPREAKRPPKRLVGFSLVAIVSGDARPMAVFADKAGQPLLIQQGEPFQGGARVRFISEKMLILEDETRVLLSGSRAHIPPERQMGDFGPPGGFE